MLASDVKKYVEGVIAGLMDKYSTAFTSNEISTSVFSANDTEVHVPTVNSNDNSTKAASTAFVKNVVQSSGGGDMLRSVYDPDQDGIIGVEQGGTNASTGNDALANLGAQQNLLKLKRGYAGYGFKILDDGTIEITEDYSTQIIVTISEKIYLPVGRYVFVEDESALTDLPIGITAFYYKKNGSNDAVAAKTHPLTISSESDYITVCFKTGLTYAKVTGQQARLMLVPYAGSSLDLKLFGNKQVNAYNYYTLDERFEEIDDQFADIVNVYGAKNLLQNTASSVVSNGITFTVNSDGSVNVNGTASATAILQLVVNYPLAKGRYILSGCPVNGGLETYNMFINNSGGSSGNIARDYGEGVEFELLSDQQVLVGIGIAQGQTVNFIYYPMIRSASVMDDTYVPYAKTNKELTENSANKTDLTDINITSGTTNNTGATITAGKYFYYNGALVKAKADIANGATLTFNTNYESAYMGDDVATIKSSLANEKIVASLPTTGYSKEDYGSFKKGGIQYVKMKVTFPNNIAGYWDLINLPSAAHAKYGSIFPITVGYGNTIYPTVGKIDATTHKIQIFISAEIATLGSINLSVYLDVNYEIA